MDDSSSTVTYPQGLPSTPDDPPSRHLPDKALAILRQREASARHEQQRTLYDERWGQKNLRRTAGVPHLSPAASAFSPATACSLARSAS
ncbi:hypothetical protein JCM10207_006306 [Rhodosporidiobolus poonsookiae]